MSRFTIGAYGQPSFDIDFIERMTEPYRCNWILRGQFIIDRSIDVLELFRREEFRLEWISHRDRVLYEWEFII